MVDEVELDQLLSVVWVETLDVVEDVELFTVVSMCLSFCGIYWIVYLPSRVSPRVSGFVLRFNVAGRDGLDWLVLNDRLRGSDRAFVDGFIGDCHRVSIRDN